jgi:hypothetical protein
MHSFEAIQVGLNQALAIGGVVIALAIVAGVAAWRSWG